MCVDNYPKFFFLISFCFLYLQCYLLIMTTTETKARQEIIQAYEWLNETDLKGIFPVDQTTEQYKAAKRRALYYTKQYSSKEVYFFILNNF